MKVWSLELTRDAQMAVSTVVSRAVMRVAELAGQLVVLMVGPLAVLTVAAMAGQ